MTMSAPELIPAWPVPPGLSSNFENPEGIGNRFVGVAIGFLTFALVVVALRLYTQIAITRKLGLDDCGYCLFSESSCVDS